MCSNKLSNDNKFTEKLKLNMLQNKNQNIQHCTNFRNLKGNLIIQSIKNINLFKKYKKLINKLEKKTFFL